MNHTHSHTFLVTFMAIALVCAIGALGHATFAQDTTEAPPPEVETSVVEAPVIDIPTIIETPIDVSSEFSSSAGEVLSSETASSIETIIDTVITGTTDREPDSSSSAVSASSEEGSSASSAELLEPVLTLIPINATDFALTEAAEFTLVTGIPEPTEGIEDDGTLNVQIASEEILHAVLSNEAVLEAAIRTVTSENQAELFMQDIATASGSAPLVHSLLVEAIRNDIVDALAPTSPEDVLEPAIAEEALADAVVTYLDTDSVRDAVEIITNTSGTSADADVLERAEAKPLFQVTLRDPDGNTSVPSYYFRPGSVVLGINPPQAFVPGTYTLTVIISDPLTGEETTFTQDFGWGVLALNPDQDVYQVEQTARLNIGVLDDNGAMVCEPKELTLSLTAPSGSVTVYRLSEGTVWKSHTCTLLDSTLVEPDFFARVLLMENGEYSYVLEAETENGVRSISGEVLVDPNVPVTITRIAATRLYPAGFSPMTLIVNFHKDFAGTLQEIVPADFVIRNPSDNGRVQQTENIQTITWNARHAGGDSIIFNYEYDAPDTSPYFYLLGPIAFTGHFSW